MANQTTGWLAWVDLNTPEYWHDQNVLWIP